MNRRAIVKPSLDTHVFDASRSSTPEPSPGCSSWGTDPFTQGPPSPKALLNRIQTQPRESISLPQEWIPSRFSRCELGESSFPPSQTASAEPFLFNPLQYSSNEEFDTSLRMLESVCSDQQQQSLRTPQRSVTLFDLSSSQESPGREESFASTVRNVLKEFLEMEVPLTPEQPFSNGFPHPPLLHLPQPFAPSSSNTFAPVEKAQPPLRSTLSANAAPFVPSSTRPPVEAAVNPVTGRPTPLQLALAMAQLNDGAKRDTKRRPSQQQAPSPAIVPQEELLHESLGNSILESFARLQPPGLDMSPKPIPASMWYAPPPTFTDAGSIPVCLDYLKGTCHQARKSCKFAHPAFEQHSMLSTPQVVEEDETSRVCEVWAYTGFCKFGNKCRFHHPPLLGQLPCAPAVTKKMMEFAISKQEHQIQ
eukprot:TRINITY_DN9702_c0_g1_i1.p1 TRINITY_DN9702_c0_g1~~TRINITY_DN9702_c0_g1_i1.p1  ORF type:complete len:432 (+),score=48.22 TRINITY_DN9702_c0_g1_i1:37-1296(+)